MGEAKRRGTYQERVAQAKALRTQRFNAARDAHMARKELRSVKARREHLAGDWIDTPEAEAGGKPDAVTANGTLVEYKEHAISVEDDNLALRRSIAAKKAAATRKANKAKRDAATP